MLPERLIPATIAHGKIIPSYLGAPDWPWIRVLLETLNRCCSKPARALDEQLALPLPCAAPPFKLRAAIAYLRELFEPEVVAKVKPSLAREALFLAAAAAHEPRRDAIVAQIAALHGISPPELEQAIVADLAGERLIRPPVRSPTPMEVTQGVNELIVRSLIGRARTISILAEGSIRALVRQAKLAGLLCTLRQVRAGASSTALEISGPFSLFRHTLLYGRALGSLLGRLPYCARFELTATCRLRGQDALFTLRADDAVFQLHPGAEPRAYDSKLEAQFAKAIRRIAPDWDLVREPEAIRAGETLIFPDFALIHRLDPSRRFLIEIIGYWTRDYLTQKLASLRAAGRRDLILCIDEARKCDDAELPAHAPIVRFRRRVRPEQVLAAIKICEESGYERDKDVHKSGARQAQQGRPGLATS